MRGIAADEPMSSYAPPPEPNGTSHLFTVPVVFTSRDTGSVIVDKEFAISRNPPSYTYGSPVNGNWQGIPQDSPVKVGDYLRFTYRFRLPLFEEWQTNHFITKLQKDNRYDVKYVAVSEDEGRVWITVKVLKLDFGLTAILIAGAIAAIGIGIGFWLVTESLESLAANVKPTSVVGFSLIIGVIALALFGFAKAKSA